MSLVPAHEVFISRLAEFPQLGKHLAEQLKAFEALKGDAGLKKEIEFETKIRDLLAKYDFSLKDVINILDPQTDSRVSTAPAKKGSRKARQVKVYKNPHLARRSKQKAPIIGD